MIARAIPEERLIPQWQCISKEADGPKVSAKFNARITCFSDGSIQSSTGVLISSNLDVELNYVEIDEFDFDHFWTILRLTFNGENGGILFVNDPLSPKAIFDGIIATNESPILNSFTKILNPSNSWSFNDLS